MLTVCEDLAENIDEWPKLIDLIQNGLACHPVDKFIEDRLHRVDVEDDLDYRLIGLLSQRLKIHGRVWIAQLCHIKHVVDRLFKELLGLLKDRIVLLKIGLLFLELQFVHIDETVLNLVDGWHHVVTQSNELLPERAAVLFSF